MQSEGPVTSKRGFWGKRGYDDGRHSAARSDSIRASPSSSSAIAILQKALLLTPYARRSNKYVVTTTAVNNMLHKNLNVSFGIRTYVCMYVCMYVTRSVLLIYSTFKDLFYKLQHRRHC